MLELSGVPKAKTKNQPELEETEAAASRPNNMRRTQILEKKKAVNKLLNSAYSSHRNHLSAFPHLCRYKSNGLSVYLELGRGNKLTSNLKQYIKKLLKVNMEEPYGAEWPAEEKVKHREMSSPEALYIFVHEVEAPSTQAKLEPIHQGKGLGKFLMQLIELIARMNCMGAVVLTVQKRNASAINFYVNKLRYNISIISPSKVRQLNGDSGQANYEILCKTFDQEAKAVLEESS